MKFIKYLNQPKIYYSILFGFLFSLVFTEKITTILLSGKGFEGRNILVQAVLFGTYFLFSTTLSFLLISLIVKFEKKSPTVLFIITGGLTGALMFVYFYGLDTLNVTNINWFLYSSGISQHYLGWVFFRNDPWTFPIGITQSLGLPFGTCIIYTDSIPLIALFFKLISFLLPTPFQYFGIWALLCFILQGGFAALIIHETTHSLPAALISSFFFCMSNVFLFRLFLHPALAGQWIILLALYFYFLNKKTKTINYYWPILFCLGFLIHPYFLVMIFVIFLGTLLERFVADRNYLNVAVWSVSSLVSVFTCMWIIGFFSGNADLDIYGLGSYQANLNALYNPYSSNWSAFLKPISNPITSLEGFNYLGLGMILLVFLALFSLLTIKNRESWTSLFKNHIGIILMIVILVPFSLSNVVTFNNSILFTYALPSWVMDIWKIFRSTGRMLWPVFYLIFILAVTQITRFLDNSHKVALVLCLAFLLQSADASRLKGPAPLFSTIPEKPTKLTSQFWEDAAQQYNAVVILPIKSFDYVTVSTYASDHHMRLNAFYFARANPNLVQNANEKIDLLKQGNATPGELYLIIDPDLGISLCKTIHDDTFFAYVNGYWVIAPGFEKTPADYADITQTRADICK
jgi:hypothetical protein